MTNNTKGFTSVEFLLSIVISSTLCIVLFSICFTFTIVEVTQYVAFSTARAHMAGHVDQQSQLASGVKKFSELLSKKGALAPLFSNGWFEISIPDFKSGSEFDSGFSNEYQPSGGEQSSYTGVRLVLNAKILNRDFALLGKTNPSGEPFTARVTGLLIREPSSKECQQQLQQDTRFRAILDFDRRRFRIVKDADKYVAMEDNGC